MRGGRGGRGGRFGGRGGVTQDLIRDNMEDLGMDGFQRLDDRSPPPLFPSTSIPAPLALTGEDIFNVQKMREITFRFQSSPYSLSRTVKTRDIARYSDKYKSTTQEVLLQDCINTIVEDATRYIPHELMDGRSISDSASRQNHRSGLNFNKLEQAEANGNGGASKPGDKKDDEEGSDAEGDELEDIDELEQDDDYGVDHYASDDGGGDDGEAVF